MNLARMANAECHCTGRFWEIEHNKRGYISASAPPILTRLRMDASPVLDYLAKGDIPSLGVLPDLFDPKPTKSIAILSA